MLSIFGTAQSKRMYLKSIVMEDHVEAWEILDAHFPSFWQTEHVANFKAVVI